MKSFKIIALLKYYILSLFIISGLFAQKAPRFTSAGHVFYMGEELFNKHGTNPTYADWTGNGNKDLIVGFHYEGRIYVYPNSGEDGPVFRSPFIPLQADGVQIIFAEYT